MTSCKDFDNVVVPDAGFRRFAQRLFQQFTRAEFLGVTAAVVRGLRDEGAEPLPSIDDALAFEVVVGALDRDDADEQFLREPAKRRQRRVRREPAFADFTRQAVDDLLGTALPSRPPRSQE